MSSPQRYYRPELDALRSVAFFSVFFFHLIDYTRFDAAAHPLLHSWQETGAFGLPLFFFLSAFLIVELLRRERVRTGTVHVQQFYLRRMLRIWPLYFLVATALTIVAHWNINFGSRDPVAWLCFTLFAGNWYIFKRWWIAGAFDPLWSISVEEQFYLTVPWLARWGGSRAMAAASVLLLPLAYVCVVHFHDSPPFYGPNLLWVNSFFEFQFFAGGALLALALRGRIPRWNVGVRATVGAAAIAAWFCSHHYLKTSSWEPPPHSVLQSCLGWLLVLGGCVLLVLAALGMEERYVPRAMVYLGRISYGMYLFHTTVLTICFLWLLPKLQPLFGAWSQTATVVVAIAGIIGLASLSYRYFEGPFLRLKQRFTFVPSRPE